MQEQFLGFVLKFPGVVSAFVECCICLEQAGLGPSSPVTADLETVILDLLEGQYKNPIRVIAFDTAEGWSQDASADIAQELRRRCDLQLRDVPSGIQDFVERHAGPDRQLALRLAKP